jgi:hypothetical protein
MTPRLRQPRIRIASVARKPALTLHRFLHQIPTPLRQETTRTFACDYRGNGFAYLVDPLSTHTAPERPLEVLRNGINLGRFAIPRVAESA